MNIISSFPSQAAIKPFGAAASEVDAPKFFNKDYQPQENDVIIGRGKKIFQHAGNAKLRTLVEQKLDEYSLATTKGDKSNIILSIVKELRYFVKLDNDTGLWLDAGDFLAREKVSQTFRDSLHSNYRSSNEFKKKRRREQTAARKGRNKKAKDNNKRARILVVEPKLEEEELQIADCWETDAWSSFDAAPNLEDLTMWRDTSLTSIPDSFELAQWFDEEQNVADDSDLFEPLPFDAEEQLLIHSIESGDFAAFFENVEDKVQKSPKSNSSKSPTSVQTVTFQAVPSIQRFAAMSA